MTQEEKAIDALKQFGLTDDEIISVAVTEGLLNACDKLIALIGDKYSLTKVSAMPIVKNIKKYFK